MTEEPGEASNSQSSSRVLLLLTNVLSLGCLYWVLRGADVSRLGHELKTMQWWWVALAVVSDVLVYFFHAWRWSLLLTPLAEVPFWNSLRAIYVGLFANEILPLRTGEVIRCYLQSRWTELPLSVSLSSAFIERIFDGAWLFVGFLITLKLVHLPKYMMDAGVVLAVLIVLGGALLAVAMFYRKETHATFSQNKILSKINIVIEDLHIIGHSRYLYFSAFASLPYLLMQVVPIYALARGYPGFDLTIAQSFALMVILRLGSVVPQAPGNVGLFQFLTVKGLLIFGVNAGVSRRFSFVMWGVITLPLLIGGFIALAITGVRVGELRRQAHHSMQNRGKEVAKE